MKPLLRHHLALAAAVLVAVLAMLAMEAEGEPSAWPDGAGRRLLLPLLQQPGRLLGRRLLLPLLQHGGGPERVHPWPEPDSNTRNRTQVSSAATSRTPRLLPPGSRPSTSPFLADTSRS